MFSLAGPPSKLSPPSSLSEDAAASLLLSLCLPQASVGALTPASTAEVPSPRRSLLPEVLVTEEITAKRGFSYSRRQFSSGNVWTTLPFRSELRGTRAKKTEGKKPKRDGVYVAA